MNWQWQFGLIALLLDELLKLISIRAGSLLWTEYIKDVCVCVCVFGALSINMCKYIFVCILLGVCMSVCVLVYMHQHCGSRSGVDTVTTNQQLTLTWVQMTLYDVKVVSHTTMQQPVSTERNSPQAGLARLEAVGP